MVIQDSPLLFTLNVPTVVIFAWSLNVDAVVARASTTKL